MHVLDRNGDKQTVEMGARHLGIPLKWTATQTNDPSRPHIAFHHIQGPLRGMDVEWIFTPLGTITEVRIVHHLDFIFPIASAFFGKYVASDIFIHGVATKTLQHMKRLAEAGAQ